MQHFNFIVRAVMSLRGAKVESDEAIS